MYENGVRQGTANTAAQFPARQIVKQLFGYSIVCACLVWVFYDINGTVLWQNISAIDWRLVGLAVVFDAISYVCQGWRWELLLRSVGHITPLRATQAIYAGLFANEILPMRVGELLRAYLVSRWISVKFISVIPSIAVERLFDALWLGAGIGVSAFFMNLPHDISHAADTMGYSVLLLIALLVYLIVFRKKDTTVRKENKKEWKLIRMVRSFIRHIADEIQVLGTSRRFYVSFAISSCILITQILAFWLVMQAYGLHLSLWIGAAVLIFLRLGTIIPNAPSNVGTYQLLCVVGLVFFGVDKTTASGFSIVVFILLTIPLWLIGLIAISRSGMSLKQIRCEVKELLKRQ
jgi:hypothetical protein